MSNLDSQTIETLASEEKPRGRPFEPGTSGNPRGRPAGARNKRTVMAEALLEGELEQLVYVSSIRRRRAT